MYTITLLRRQFEQVLSALLRQPHAVAVGRAGRNRTADGTELLCRDFSVVASQEPSPADGDRVFLALARTNAELRDSPRTGLPASPAPRARALAAFLTVGADSVRGQLSGAIFTERGDLAPLDTLKLVGAGMYQFRISDFGFRISDWPDYQSQIANRKSQIANPVADWERERWSRTIGALGGDEVWQRLVSLRHAVIGVGRTGSLVAATLARLGVRDLTLIDPDVVESHNLGEMDAVTDAHLGQPKVEAVLATLHQLTISPTHHFTALPHRVTERESLAALKSCDVLFCCVDHDAPRLATTVLATLTLKPLIDIGTGIHFATSEDPIRNSQFAIRNRTMGADLRLLLPGESCLLCRGGLAHEEEARKNLLARNLFPEPDQTYRWNQQRAGSLRTLNQLAAHLGVQMWLDLVAGRIGESVWARLEFDDAGRMSVQYPPSHQSPVTSHQSPTCPLCAKAGLGDEGLGWT